MAEVASIFLDARGFADTKLPKGHGMDDQYVHNYLVNLLPWSHLIRERVGWVEYIDRIEFHEGIQIAAKCFPPDTQQSKGVGYIQVYRQREDGNYFRHRFWHDIFHEIGHLTYEGLFEHARFRRAWLKVWEGSASVFRSLQIKGEKSSDQEEFAQTYALYIEAGANLSEQHPMRYDFMKERIFLRREYKPWAI